jgi:hypothetical protein
MKTLIFTLAVLFLFTAQAYSYDYQRVSLEDAFTDSFYLTEAEGTTHPDKLWAGATVNYDAVPPSIDGSEFTRTYLKFDLTDISNIDKAYLWLYRVKDNWSYNDPDKGNISVYREIEDWNESTITWQNAPNFFNNTKGNTTYIDMPEGGWVSWNVSSFAKQTEGGNLSLVLAGSEPFHIFDSSASSDHKPFLGINVVPEPVSMLLFGIGGAVMAFAKRKKLRS